MDDSEKSAFGRREIITLVCLVIFFGFLVLIATPNLIGPKRSGPGWNANICINNLRQIDGAKQQWGLENGITNGDVAPAEYEITSYLGSYFKGNFPRCPSGGKYIIEKLNEPPTCSLGSNVNPPHVLQ